MTGDRGSSVPKLQVIQGLTWIGWHLLLSREQDTQLPSTRVKSVWTCLQGGYLGNPCNKSATGLPSHVDLVLVSHRLLNISIFFSIFTIQKNIYRETPFPTQYSSVKGRCTIFFSFSYFKELVINHLRCLSQIAVGFHGSIILAPVRKLQVINTFIWATKSWLPSKYY